MNRFKLFLFLVLSLSVFSTHAGSEVEVKPAPDTRYSNWELISDQEGIKTFRRDAEDGAVGFRGEVTFDLPLEKIATLLADMESRKKWMDGVVEAKRIRMTSLFDRVEYNHTSVPWPFQDRDFVYSAKVDLDALKRTMVISMHSTEDPDMPKKDGVVRGKMLESRYFLHEIEANKRTFVTVEIMVDPMGAIPKWLARLKQKKWPRNTLNGIRTYLSKNEVVVPDEFKLLNLNK